MSKPAPLRLVRAPSTSCRLQMPTVRDKVAQEAAGRLGLLTDADRETLRLEKETAEGSIVADRLFSWNGAISLLMVLSSIWFVANLDQPRGPLLLLWLPGSLSAVIYND